MTDKLRECPFCGGEVTIGVFDSEGNRRPPEYENDPWSGLRFALLHHTDEECPISTYDAEILGIYLYDTRAEAAAAWNRRVAPDDAEAKRIMNLLIEEREAHSREVRTLWDQIYWQRAELAAIRRALNEYQDAFYRATEGNRSGAVSDVLYEYFDAASKLGAQVLADEPAPALTDDEMPFVDRREIDYERADRIAARGPAPAGDALAGEALAELKALVEYIDNLPKDLATLLGVDMMMNGYAMNNARSVLQRARQLQERDDE